MRRIRSCAISSRIASRRREERVVRNVLLVDPNVDALATLAQGLRRRGLRVQLANGTSMACERAKKARFDAILAWHELAESSSDTLGLLDALAVETGRVPPFLLLVDDPAAPRRREQVLRADVEGIFARLVQMASEPAPSAPLSAPSSSGSMLAAASPSSGSMLAAASASTSPSAISGLLARTPLRDLLLSLAADRRTGTVTVTTPLGAGELRLHDGDIVDAVYLRLEGGKAVARLLGERDGAFSFLPRTPPVMRRINVAMAALLERCEKDNEAAKAARASLAHLEKKALFATDLGGAAPKSTEPSDLARVIVSRLRSPAAMDDVLEELPASDAEVLRAIKELDAAGRIKVLSQDAERVPLVGPEGLHAMRAQAALGKAQGYDGATRIVFAGTPGRLAVTAHSALSLADAVPAPDAQPTVPAPYVMASVRLGDDVSVDLVALPLVPAYAPLWPMALAGSAVVVRLDDAAADVLADACAAAEVSIVLSSALVPQFDEGNAAHVAGAVRGALETVVG
jgi:CheY-like chemotaxis protein